MIRGRLISSLRWRLPMLILGLLAAGGGIFTWMAYSEMRHALRLAADERARTTATQLADLLAQSAAARAAETRRLAADPAVRRFVLTGDDPESALTALRPFAQRNPQGTILLQSRGGATPTRVAHDNIIVERAPDFAARSLPVADGIGLLHVTGGHVTYRAAAAIGQSPGEPVGNVGELSIEHPLSSASSANVIGRLIGSGASVKLGNAAGDVWTDLSGPVAAPPSVSPGATVSFADSTGGQRLGATAPISGTPWRVWVEFDEAALMGPASTLVHRMRLWTIGLIVLGVAAVWALSTGVTKPLEQMADAADAIASGDYSRRANISRQDEIGRLGSAFNLMAARVAESREALEARVRERTRELTYSREEMDQFFAMSLDLLSIADLHGRFTRVNPAWENVLGWSSADLTASPYVNLVHPEDVASTLRESEKLAAGGAVVNFENRYRCKDGGYRWLSWKAVANPDRELIYATARDVTDEKRAARDLQHYAAELSVANRELEAFSYSVSHDLRSPLRSIDGFSQALLEDCGDRLGSDGQEHLRRIRGAAQHMGQLIDDLLKLARVTRADLTFEAIDLSAIAQRTLTRLAETHTGRDVSWKVHPGLRATGDPRLIEIAVTNLLENAWKFTGKRPHGEIEFGVRNGDGRPREYFVRDNGAGFDATYASKLFGAFQRLHHAADFPGTGIGLATVQRIVTRHGGYIRAEGTPDQGATFAFTLPAEASV